MSKIYVGDVGTEIILDCGVDISTATVRKIKVRKPDGTNAEWAAVSEGTKAIKYVVQAGDIAKAGVWRLQAYIEMPGWLGSGQTVDVRVYDLFR